MPVGQLALNFGRIKDPDLDKLLDENRAVDDPARKKAIAEERQQAVRQAVLQHLGRLHDLGNPAQARRAGSRQLHVARWQRGCARCRHCRNVPDDDPLARAANDQHSSLRGTKELVRSMRYFVNRLVQLLDRDLRGHVSDVHGPPVPTGGLGRGRRVEDRPGCNARSRRRP